MTVALLFGVRMDFWRTDQCHPDTPACQTLYSRMLTWYSRMRHGRGLHFLRIVVVMSVRGGKSDPDDGKWSATAVQYNSNKVSNINNKSTKPTSLRSGSYCINLCWWCAKQRTGWYNLILPPRFSQRGWKSARGVKAPKHRDFTTFFRGSSLGIDPRRFMGQP